MMKMQRGKNKSKLISEVDTRKLVGIGRSKAICTIFRRLDFPDAEALYRIYFVHQLHLCAFNSMGMGIVQVNCHRGKIADKSMDPK